MESPDFFECQRRKILELRRPGSPPFVAYIGSTRCDISGGPEDRRERKRDLAQLEELIEQIVVAANVESPADATRRDTGLRALLQYCIARDSPYLHRYDEVDPQRQPLPPTEAIARHNHLIALEHAFSEALARREAGIEALPVEDRPAGVDDTRTIDDLLSAFAALCEHLKTEAMSGTPAPGPVSATPSQDTGTAGFSSDIPMRQSATNGDDASLRALRRRRFVEPLLDQRNMSALEWASAATPKVDYHTVRGYLDGRTARLRTNTRTRLAEPLGVAPMDLPE